MLRLALMAVLVLVGYAIYLDFTVRQSFAGSRWTIPAHVYSRPLELFAGRRLGRDDLIQELRQLGYRNLANPASAGSYVKIPGGVRIHLRNFASSTGYSGSALVDVHIDNGTVTRLADADGNGLGGVHLEPRLMGSISPVHHEDRILVQRKDIPDHLINALLSIEDRNYYQHFGVDPRGLARALWANLVAGEVVQGGSTLTQQLAKNLYLSREKTLQRKLTEMIIAVLLEAHYDKDEILEAYINEVFLGQSGNRAVHGFGLASQFYFGRPLGELKLQELALLAAMVKGASFYNPFRSPERAKERRNLVLDKMVEYGYLDRTAASNAKKSALGVTRQGALSATDYPAFLDFVRLQLRRDYDESDLRTEGLHIVTSLDPLIQKSVEESITRRLPELERARGLPTGTLQAAVLVVRSDNGEVAALAGGKRAGYAGFNRALEAERPIGSLIKPVVFLAAFEQGYSLASILDDSPLTVAQRGLPDWKPKNYDGKSHGSVRLIDALSYSYNISTTRLGLEVGVERVVSLLHRLGLKREVNAYPSLLLGAVNMTPVEMTQLYLAFASGGFLMPLRTTRSILNQQMQPLARYPLSLREIIDGDATTVLNAGLQSVVTKGTAKSLNTRFPSALALAGKTGTTDGYRDSWFAGYAGNYLAVVWIGRDDNKPTKLTGASGALQLWGDIMAGIPIRAVDLPEPTSIEYAEVNHKGQLANGCDGATMLPFAAGTLPREDVSCVRAKKRKSQPQEQKGWLERLFDTDRK